MAFVCHSTRQTQTSWKTSGMSQSLRSRAFEPARENAHVIYDSQPNISESVNKPPPNIRAENCRLHSREPTRDFSDSEAAILKRILVFFFSAAQEETPEAREPENLR